MKYKLHWGYVQYGETKSKEFRKYSNSLMDDIDKLIEFGYTYFEIEVLENKEIKKK